MTALRDPRIALAGLILTLIVLIALVGPLLMSHAPSKVGVGPPLQKPGGEFLLGTDSFGRDELSRVVAGARISVVIAVVVTAASMAIALPLGLIIGYRGGVLDFIAGRGLDVLFAFPGLLLALLLSTVLGPGLTTVAIALVIIYVPVITRFVRGAVASERSLDYVSSARVAGATTPRILVHHIAPNIMSPVVVLATSIMSFTVLAEAALSYLGLGAQPPTASWGKMLTENSDYLSTAPYLVIIPGAAIAVLVLALNLLGDGLRDHLDPRYRETTELTASGSTAAVLMPGRETGKGAA